MAQQAKNTVLTFGKYAGKTLEEVYHLNWKYLSWLAYDTDVTRNGVYFSMLASDVLEAHDDEKEQQSINRRSY